MIKISVVIPCYRSEQTITSVVESIIETMAKRPAYDYEVILVNDGSPDNTFSVLSELAEKHSCICAVDLTKNFGQHSALMAGYSLVSGDYILGMDDDGEHDPSRLFDLVDELEKGYDYVCAQFPSFDRSIYKKLGSKLNNWMATKFVGKPEDAIFSSYYIMRRFVVDEIVKTKNPHPYVGGMIVAVTQRLSSVPMPHSERISGTSSYNFKNSLFLWLSGITSFSAKPLRIASYVGFLVALLGFLLGIIMIVRKFLEPSIAAGYTSLVALLLFVGGLQMALMGLMGEYIGSTYMLVNSIPQYSIRTIVKKDS